MKKIRGMMVLAAVLVVLAFATVVHADSLMGTCYFDAKGNIVWCTD